MMNSVFGENEMIHVDYVDCGIDYYIGNIKKVQNQNSKTAKRDQESVQFGVLPSRHHTDGQTAKFQKYFLSTRF